MTAEQVQEALKAQEGTCVGLLQALAGTPWPQCVADTGVPHLAILPVARGCGEDRGQQVAPAEVKRLLAEVRAAYDIVVIDTGPIPGSVESAILTAEADQTVLIVSRGDPRVAVEDAVEMLEAVGAKLAGVVFNRAQERDFGRSVSGRSVRARSGVRARRTQGAQFGPVGNAVMQRRR